MPYLREIWHFKPKRLLHQGIENSSIAKIFSILLQYNSKYRIFLFIVLQKKYIYILRLLFHPKFLSHPFHFFYSLLSLPSLFSICSLLSKASSSKFLTYLQNFSPILHGLSLISHRMASLSLHQCWVLDFLGWRLD